MDSRDIGRKVRDLRKKRGMTLVEFARRVDLTQAQISRLENGKQGFRSATLLRIAKALDVKPIYFFMDEGEAGDEGKPPYGLLAGGPLAEALSSPEFVWAAGKLADAYLNWQDAFAAILTLMDVVLQRESSPARAR